MLAPRRARADRGLLGTCGFWVFRIASRQHRTWRDCLRSEASLPLNSTQSLKALPVGVGSTAAARECRVALREGEGAPARKEEVAALSGGQANQEPTSFLCLSPTTRPTQGRGKLTVLMGKEAFKDDEVVHLEDEANKAHCPLSLSTQDTEAVCQKPRWASVWLSYQSTAYHA